MGQRDLDAQRIGERAELSLALKRQQRARHGGGADDRRIRPLEIRPSEGLAQHAAIKRGVVGDHHPPLQTGLQERKHILGERRVVDHRLRDPGEPLDPAAQRKVRAHE